MSFKGLTIGVSGLQAQSQKMEVIGNNLANVNTTAFKSSQVNFQEAFYDVVKNASGPVGNIGGSNPISIGSGVEVGSVSTIFTQGARQSTDRALDFMIEGEDFFVVKNGADDSLMLTRNGAFSLDGDMNLVDSLGNRVMGFNVDPELGTQGSTAEAITLPTAAVSPNATTEVELEANIDSSVVEALALTGTNAFEIFSGGENFGGMEISVPGGSGTRETYGSGFYRDGFDYTDASATINAGLDTVTLAAAPANMIEGFSVGDTVSVLQGTDQVQRTITAVNTGTRAITLSSAAPAAFSAGTLQITNLTVGKSSQGSSGATHVHNDVLKSQVAMVDQNGRLLASFYRVSDSPAAYTRATANVTGGTEITVGNGEFTNMAELKEGIELALRDNQLSNYASSTDLEVTLDKYGKITFSGTGMVESFRLVVNAENTEMLNRFTGIAITDNGASATTQARIDSSAEIIAPPSLALGNRSVNASKDWYDTSGLQNYGYSATAPSTEYGEFAGLRLDSGASGNGYGLLQLSLVNGLGNTVVEEFKMVARDPDLSANEFTTMGELATLVQNTLRQASFSSVAVDGTLTADLTASASISNGRLSVNTSSGVFRSLQLSPVNTAADATNGIDRSDSMNFGTVLGELATGVNGKTGISNKFIRADISTQTRIYDNLGNEHTAITYLVRDRSQGLTNVEWKFKTGLNPNVNTFASEKPDDKNVYGNTYNSIEDSSSARGVLAFDIESGAVLGPAGAGSDSRYVSSANLQFLPATESQEANESNISIDFSKVTSFNGRNTIVGNNIDGFPMGSLVRITTEANTGQIKGVYSNGQIRTMAKVGLMSIANPEGLLKVGSSYYNQTPNSSRAGNPKGVDQIFAVGEQDNASTDSVQSKIHGNALEASNVDLTEQLTNLITTQRSFSAAGRIITTSDNLLQEALQLIR